MHEEETRPGVRTAHGALHGASVISIGYLPWSPLRKRHQSIVTEFARLIHARELFFINPPLRLLDELLPQHKGGRASDKERAWLFGSLETMLSRRVDDRVRAWTPLRLVPFDYRLPLLSRVNDALAAALCEVLRPRGRFILFCQDFRPWPAALIRSLRGRAAATVFDYSDGFEDFYDDPRERAEVARSVEEISRHADLVLAVNEKLLRRISPVNPRAILLQNGVSDQLIDECAVRDGQHSLDAYPRPRLGYVGLANRARIDCDLVKAVAMRHPSWSILFIGYADAQVRSSFADRRNVHFLPAIPYEELPRFLRGLDAGILPHLDNEHCRGNDPLKYYMYLGAGLPVLSTQVAGAEHFEPPFVNKWSDAAGFVEGAPAVLANWGERERAAARRIALAHTWRARAATTLAALEEIVAARAAPPSGRSLA